MEVRNVSFPCKTSRDCSSDPDECTCKYICNPGSEKILDTCYREANKCVDALARRGALMNRDFVIFSEPPFDIDLLLRLDANGTMYDHSISLVSFLSLYFV